MTRPLPLRVAACAALFVVAACDRAGTPLPPAPSAAATALVAPAEPNLPTSTSTTPAPANALLVTLSRERLSLGSSGEILAAPDADPASWSKGFEARYKRASRNDYYLVPLGSALEVAYPGDAGLPPVVVAADRSISYRMLTETLFTLGQQRSQAVSLLVRSGAGTAAIPFAQPGRYATPSPASEQVRLAIQQLVTGAEAGAPLASAHPVATASPSAPSVAMTLALNVIVTARGFVVSAMGQRIGPGCHEAAPGTAVPKRDDAYDFAALTACATILKASDPRFASETRGTITADAGIDVQTVVSTMDALRGASSSTGGSLFPEVMLGVPR